MLSCLIPLRNQKEEFQDEDLVCCICLEAIRDGDETRYQRVNKIVFFFSNKRSKHTLPCGHTFHSGCIHKWMNVSLSCPLCRQRVQKKQRLKDDKLEEDSRQRLKLDVTLFMQWVLTTSFVPIYFLRRDGLVVVWILLCVFPSPLTIVVGVILIWYESMVCELGVWFLIPLLVTLTLNTSIILMKRKGMIHERNQPDLV